MKIDVEKMTDAIERQLTKIEDDGYKTSIRMFVGKFDGCEVHLIVTNDEDEAFGGEPRHPIIS